MDELVKKIAEIVDTKLSRLKVILPPSRHDLMAFAHKNGAVLAENYDDLGYLHLEINIPEEYFHKFEPFIVNDK